ncbi:MAG TPA: DUF5696 domain-containing protein [Capsulimonadaceae bacterium]|jgi:hypothetical protein
MLQSTSKSISPMGNRLVCDGPGWHNPLEATTVATCHLYNTLEARDEWHSVTADWDRVSVSGDRWIVPCRVDIPFVHTVVSFDIVGRESATSPSIDISIPESSIVEHDISFARLMRIELLPGFGAASQGESGYLLLPCLSGALHEFNRSVCRTERIGLYGRQDQWAMKSNFDCIGIHRDSASWCAIVTEGDRDAEAVVRSCFDESRTYSIHYGFVYRWEHVDDRISGDRSVRYSLMDPERGGWAAFAREYRAFLRNERGVRTWAEKASDHPKVAAFAHGFAMKIFQGCKTPDFGGRGRYQSATTFAEARGILERMQADGIAKITVELVGWNDEGHDGHYPSRFPVNEVEGGAAGMKELIAWGNENGLIISVHDNALDSYERAADFSHDDGLVLRDGRVWRNVPWCGGFNWRMCPKPAMRHIQREYPRVKELGVDGHYYVDALAAFYPCHSPDHPANRSEYIDGVRDILKFTRNLFGTLSLEVPFGPYFDLMDGVYINESADGIGNFTDFGTNYIDSVVPFLPIALHNSVRYHRGGDSAGGLAGALRTLAWGAMPFIECSARPVTESHPIPGYDVAQEFAAEGYRLCCVEHGDLVDVDLDDVEIVGDDLYVTRYANGVQLHINVTASPQTISGVLVDALSVVRIDPAG